jgi:hypothetical protein
MLVLAAILALGATAQAQLAPVLANEIRVSKWDGSNNVLSSESYYYGTYRTTDRCRQLSAGGGRGGRGGRGGKAGATPPAGGDAAARGGKGSARVTKVEKGADLDCGFWEAGGCEGTASKSLAVGKADGFSVERPAADPAAAKGGKGRARMAFMCTHKSAKS